MNKEDYNELCLQDKQIINYIISSFRRVDENYDEMEKYKNNWNELKKWLEGWLENDKYCYLAENPIDKCRCEVYKELLNKIQEMEQVK